MNALHSIEFSPYDGIVIVRDYINTVRSTNPILGDNILMSKGGPTIKSLLDNHITNISTNPHNVTKNQIGLGNVDNTADLSKPISIDVQNALDLKADMAGISSHVNDLNNPHQTTKLQIGLSNVDNTSDISKPISTLTQTALDLKVDKAYVDVHINNINNPHNVNKSQVGLSNVDNTSDLLKPISTSVQTALDLKNNLLVAHSYHGKSNPALVLAKDTIANVFFGSAIKIAIKGYNASAFTFINNNIVFPKLADLHHYWISVRYKGTTTAGANVTTSMYLVRANGYTGAGQLITITTLLDRKINYEPSTNVIVNSNDFRTWTDGVDDPYSVIGMTLGIENRTNSSININEIEIIIRKDI